MHDCEADDSDETSDLREAFEADAAERSKQRRAEEREARRAASTELKDAVEQASGGDPAAVHQLLAYYDRELAAEATAEDGNYWALHKAFYEPASTALLEATRREGWSYLCDVLDAYWPETTLDFEEYADLPRRGYDRRYGDHEAFPHVSHVITNAVGRHLIHTRKTEGVGVDAVPVDVPEYLLLFHRDPGDDGSWTQSMTYGWTIGHPEHSVVESFVGLVEGDYTIWAGAAIEHAFHADQHATAALLETVFEQVDTGLFDPVMLLSGLASIEKQYYPSEPEHVDWEAVYPEFASEGFDWDPDVRQRVRDLVDRTGIFGRREEWTFADLEV